MCDGIEGGLRFSDLGLGLMGFKNDDLLVGGAVDFGFEVVALR